MIMSQDAALLKAKEEFQKMAESTRQAPVHRPHQRQDRLI